MTESSQGLEGEQYKTPKSKTIIKATDLADDIKAGMSFDAVMRKYTIS